jgi:hypothetical protein
MPAPRSRTGSSKGSGSRSKNNEVSLLGGDMFGESMFGDSLFGQTSNKKGTSIIQDIVNIQAKCIGQSINYKVAENVMELTKDNPMMVAMAPGLAMHYAKGKCMQTMFGGGGFCIPQPTQQTRNPVVTNNVMVYDMADMNAKLDKIIAEKLESAKTNSITPPAKVEEVIENETVVKFTNELTAMKAQIASLVEKNAAPDTNASVEIKPSPITREIIRVDKGELATVDHTAIAKEIENRFNDIMKSVEDQAILDKKEIMEHTKATIKANTDGILVEFARVAASVKENNKKFDTFADQMHRNNIEQFDNISKRLEKLEMFNGGRDPLAEIESMKLKLDQSPVGELGTLKAKSDQHDIQLAKILNILENKNHDQMMKDDQPRTSSASRPDKIRTHVVPHQHYNTDFMKPPQLFAEPRKGRPTIDNESDNEIGAF